MEKIKTSQAPLWERMENKYRFLQLLLVALIALLTASLIGNVYQAVGSNKVETRFVAMKEKNGVFSDFKILPSNLPKAAIEAYTRSQLREYTYNRTFVPGEDNWEHYKYVLPMSTKQVIEQFKLEWESLQKNFKGYRREVEVVYDTPILTHTDVKVHHVEFITYDWTGSKRTPINTVATNNWIAIIKYVFRPDLVTEDQKYNNPFGLYVVDYAITKKS